MSTSKSRSDSKSSFALKEYKKITKEHFKHKNTLVVDEHAISEKLKVHDAACSYFDTQPKVIELRADISNRLAYLSNFLDDDGTELDDSKSLKLKCCSIITNDFEDTLLTVINSCLYKRNKYRDWKCDTYVSLHDFKTEMQVREWVISGRCLSCQNYAFTKGKSLQGCILTDTYECHKIHINYDLFYTYLSRIINTEQLHICEDTSCCYPKDKTKRMDLNINTYKDMVLNETCSCGSKKKYEKCCYRE